jgi:hypothetical protein
MTVLDNFKPTRPPHPRREPQVAGPREPVGPREMDDLARSIRGGVPAPQTAEDYAPQTRRIEHLEQGAIRMISKFADLPLDEIDRLIDRAKSDLENLIARAINFRQNIVDGKDQLTADFERYLAGVKLTQEMFEKLVEQCGAIGDSVSHGEVKASLGEMRLETERREQRAREATEAERAPPKE